MGWLGVLASPLYSLKSEIGAKKAKIFNTEKTEQTEIKS